MKKNIFILFFILPLFFCACEELEEAGLSEEEIVNGLKTALNIGADSSCSALNKTDAYYKNTLLKILLPAEADVIFDNLSSFSPVIQTEINNEVEKVILGINRAAEDAADDAKPIFIDAITNMSVTEGLNILNGKNLVDINDANFDSTAATHYLDLKTRPDLTKLFSPIIDVSLDKDLGIGFSANEAWANLVVVYNTYAMFSAMEQVANVSLGTHCTDKALAGLFYKVGEEEKKIRDNPFNWANDLIQKVFGEVYKE